MIRDTYILADPLDLLFYVSQVLPLLDQLELIEGGTYFVLPPTDRFVVEAFDPFKLQVVVIR